MQSDANAGQIIVSNTDGLRNVEILTSPNDRSVAQLGKYWVLTNLFDSPYIYNLTSKTDKCNADNLPKQDASSPEQQFILSEAQSIPMSSSQISIPSTVINTSFQNNQQLLQNVTIHNTVNQAPKSSQQILREVLNSSGQHIVLQVSNDDMVVDQNDSKCQKLVQNTMHLNDINQFSHDHQLQVQQIIDNELNHGETIHPIKQEGQTITKQQPSSSVVSQTSGDRSQLPNQMVDVHSGDGVIQMNIDDISQFLNYHEVFGKIPNDNILTVPSLTTTTTSAQSTSHLMNIIQTNASQSTATKFLTPKLEGFATSIPQSDGDKDDDASSMLPGSHSCGVCGKVFNFKYQLIVHRRYHARRKPFVCQVCGQAFVSTVELSAHGKSHDNNGNSMFTCNVCYHVFANEASLERHMKRHSTDKPFGCSVCLKTFARKEHLDNHFRSHSGESPFRCQFCAKTFTRKEHMQNHERKHTSTAPRCDICNKSFTRKEHYINHSLWHNGTTPHQCSICNKKYTRKEHLANHMRSHTQETPFRCQICGKSFTRKEHFTNHILWHSGETNHRCDFCSKTFTRKEHLLNHVRQHTGESPHKCDTCMKTFTRKEHLLNHVRQHTGEKPFQCTFCTKAFTRKDHLVNHNLQHSGEKPFKCTYCTKAFTRKDHLVNHVKQHTGESQHKCTCCTKTFTRKEHLLNHINKPHKCQYCAKAFTRKEHLTNHLRHHTNSDSSHVCTICNKPFGRKEHLINHMSRCHTDRERPFSCLECGKSFPLKGNLLFHQRCHNKGVKAERNFQCDLCPKDFISKGHLVSHRRSHSGERPFSCQHCSKAFVGKGNWLRHVKKSHPHVTNPQCSMSKPKETKVQSIPTSVVTLSPPTTASTVTSITGGQAIQQQITMMQHQQLRKQQQHHHQHHLQFNHQPKTQLQNLMEPPKTIITKIDSQPDHQHDPANQQQKNQLQTLLDMQKSIIITNHAQHQSHATLQQISDHQLIEASQDSLPITILRTTSQNIGLNAGVHMHQLSASTDQHSIVY